MRLLFVVAALIAASPIDARVIHQERSLYQNILVTQERSRLCLKFTVRKDQRNQSCVDQRKPREMVFAYTRMMMAALLLMPEPENILIVGLGGGTLPTALAELLPNANLDVVEIDPAVVSVAEQFFAYRPNANTRVIVQDARVFTKRAVRSPRRYDLIMLDAYNGDYIPEHLMTREYLEETRALLSERGVVAANTFSISGLYDHESETYFQVFGPFINFAMGNTANRIVLASVAPLPSHDALRQAARGWRSRLQPYGVRVTSFPQKFHREPDWDRSKRPLTDQYSPANLLRN